MMKETYFENKKAIIAEKKEQQFARLYKIAKVVEEEHGLEKGSLRKRTRAWKYVNPRKMLYKLAFDFEDNVLSLDDVGGLTGHHHSTVIYCVKKCEDHIKSEKEFAKIFGSIKNKLDRNYVESDLVEMFP